MNNTQDRISKYLSMLNKGMLFDQLSDEYLKSADLYEILKEIPVPVSLNEQGDITTLSMALDMAKVIGGEPNYPYTEQYLKYLDKVCGDKTVTFLVAEGAKSADAGKFEEACMYFRAALCSDPKSCAALYLYGRACQGAYETASAINSGDGEDDVVSVSATDSDYVGSFKAESIEAFELLTVLHPEFAMGFYFLGYAYLNLGLYTKACLTWKEFLNLVEDDSNKDYMSQDVDSSSSSNNQLDQLIDVDELKQEITERLESLEEPVVIEQAINKILGGDYYGGKSILVKYKEGRYSKWWPLWYYLGISESALNNVEAAIEYFKQALVYSPSNTDIMQELVDIYSQTGDKVNEEKYRKKIDIVS